MEYFAALTTAVFALPWAMRAARLVARSLEAAEAAPQRRPVRR